MRKKEEHEGSRHSKARYECVALDTIYIVIPCNRLASQDNLWLYGPLVWCRLTIIIQFALGTLSYMYFWYLKRGCLFETGCSFLF